MKYFKTILNLGFLFFCFSCGDNTTFSIPSDKCFVDFTCTKYCFFDNYCTDYFCEVLGDPDCHGDYETKKSKKMQDVKRINLSTANNQEVVEQFLFALEVYSKFANNREGIKKDSLYISGLNNYFVKLDSIHTQKRYVGKAVQYGENEVIIENLISLFNLNIKNKVELTGDSKGVWFQIKGNDKFKCRVDSSFYFRHLEIFKGIK